MQNTGKQTAAGYKPAKFCQRQASEVMWIQVGEVLQNVGSQGPAGYKLVKAYRMQAGKVLQDAGREPPARYKRARSGRR